MPGKRIIVVPDMRIGKPTLSKVTVGVALVGFLAGSAQAAPVPVDEMGARSLGRGGVGRADGADVSGEELNLASVSLVPAYSVYGGAELGPDARFLARSGAVDSRTSPVALGAGYRWRVDDVPPTGADLPGWAPVADDALGNPTSAHRVHLGAALPFLERRLSLAVHTRFDWWDAELSGKGTAFNFGFSVAGRPLPSLTVAAAARNLLTTSDTRTTREVDLGLRFDPGPYLGIEADVVAPIADGLDIETFAWRAGADISATTWLAVRGGWSMEAGAHNAHAGIGLVSDKATLDYGIKVRLDAPERNWHALDLRVNF
ncbi:MAG: hypothetical protein Q8P18_20115 [Pseudomonadota bacterium]|nr:hypothetical protein [Pseudomonadota bacterium]